MRSFHMLAAAPLLGMPVLAHAVPVSTLTGAVFSAANKRPLNHVSVRISDLKRTTLTDAQGNFSLERIPAGRYLVGFHRNHFESKHVWVSFPMKGPLEIELEIAVQKAEVTVTASPWAVHPMETAQQTGSVSQEEALTRSGMSLGEAVSELPGVRNVPTGDISGVPMIRGMVNERVSVLENGVGVNYQGFSRRHMPTVEPLDSDRYDVVRGPASVLFGSQAIGGAVNLVPAPLPSSREGDTLFSGKLSLGYGSVNEGTVGRFMLEGAQGGFGWRAAITERTGNDTQTPDGNIPNTDFRSGSWMVAGGYAATWGQIQGRARHFGNRFGFYVPASPLFRLDLQDDLQALESSLYLPAGLLDLSVTRQENHRRAYPNGTALSPGVDLVLDTTTYRARLKHLPTSGFQGDVALEFMDQSNRSLALTPSGMKTLLPDYDTRAWAASIFEEWRPGTEENQGWILSFGLRRDNRDLEILPDLRTGLEKGLGRSYQATTGSLGAVYRFTPHYSLAATWGRGWRHPSEFELFAAGPHDGVAAYESGNPDLREEKSSCFDLSARVDHKLIRASLTLFENRFKDYIYLYETGLPPVGGLVVLSFAQTNARTRGIEVEASVPLGASFEARGNYEHLTTRNESTGKSLPFTPPDRASLGTRWNLGSQDTSATGHMDLRATWTGNGHPSGSDEPFGSINGRLIETKSYILWNLAGGCNWHWSSVRFTSDLTVSNLFNKRYVDFLDTYKQFFPAPGRSVRITLTATF